MATAAKSIAGERTEGAPLAQRVLNLTNIWLGLAGITVAMVAARLYQQVFAWSKGLDSFSPEFRAYWWNLLLAEWALEGIAAALLWGWLWKTRDRELDKGLAPQVELKRYFNLVMWVMAYAFQVFWAASFFGEQDATWHQTLVRDTEFTPSHIILFYFSMPVYIILGVAGFLYAHTRLPYYHYKKGWSLPYLWVVAGPALILVNVAFNEWGHTFWVMEEFFAHPLHWGFVVLGWTALAFFGVFLQFVPRALELIRKLGNSAALDKSAA